MVAITKPTVGGSTDTWGTTLNTALDTLASAVTTLEGSSSSGGSSTGGIPLSTVTTSGDLIVGSGSGAVTRLGKGTSGFSLQSQTAGVMWGIQSGSLVCKLRQSTAASLVSGTWTSLAFQTIDNDGLGTFSAGGTSYAPGFAGWFEVSGGVAFATSSTGVRACCWALTGAQVPASAVTMTNNAGALAESLCARTMPLQLGASDTISLQGWHSNGSALSTSVTPPHASYMMVRFLGY